jgi:hypothetical protein
MHKGAKFWEKTMDLSVKESQANCYLRTSENDKSAKFS